MLEYTVLHWRADMVCITNFRWYPVDQHKSMLTHVDYDFDQTFSLASQAQLLASEAELLASQAQLRSLTRGKHVFAASTSLRLLHISTSRSILLLRHGGPYGGASKKTIDQVRQPYNSPWWLLLAVLHRDTIKRGVRTINDRNICERRRCRKNNG